jgi:hypothetical protein
VGRDGDGSSWRETEMGISSEMAVQWMEIALYLVARDGNGDGDGSRWWRW